MTQNHPVIRVQNKKEKIRKQIEELKRELSSLDSEEVYATQLTELCPDCKGKGEERYTDAAGSGDWRDCSTCHGWGYIEKEVCCPSCEKGLDEMFYLRRESMPHCPYCGQYLGSLFKAVIR